MTRVVLAFSFLLVFAPMAGYASIIIDFEDQTTGTDITQITVGSLVVDFEADDTGGNVDRFVAFDTTNPTGGDTDLAGPGSGIGGNDWDGGNAVGINYGIVGIIQENNNNVADDAARGGTITATFNQKLTGMNFVHLDLDDNSSEEPDEYSIEFFNDNVSVGSFTFDEFLNGGLFGNNNVAYGENFANVLPGLNVDITMDDLGGNPFDKVLWTFEGSGALGDLCVTTVVPVPAPLFMLAFAVLGMAGLRRKMK